MKAITLSILVLFSVSSFGRTPMNVTCDVTDVSGEIQIGIAYKINKVNADLAYLDAGSHLVKLQNMTIGGIKTPFFEGHDTHYEYSFFSGNEDLLFLKTLGSEEEPIAFRCQ